METQVQQEEDFVLEPPAAIKLPTPSQAERALAPISAEKKADVDAKVAARVQDFVERISAADMRSDAFRNMLDRAFAAGRAEITDTSAFIKASPVLNQAKLADYAELPGADALRELTTLLAKANPKGKDLLGPVKVMGVTLPFGNKLRSYLDDFKPMGERMNELIDVLSDEEDAQLREFAEYDIVEGQLFGKLEKLDRATEYLTMLDGRLTEESKAIAESNPEKAKALTDEVQFYVRGNLTDVISHKLLVVAAIGQVRQYRHTGRMTLRSTQRIRTLGVDALAIGQTMAVFAYKQQKRMDLNRAAQKAVNDVVGSLGDAVEAHTKRVIEFESNPVLAIQSLETTMDKTLGAIKALSDFRTTAVEAMAAENVKLGALFDKSKTAMRIEQKASKTEYGDVFSI
jgi:uncharacterized protein YaaN involved in tellurite resistance